LTWTKYALAMNPSIWGEDVDEFDPDRWYSLSADAASPYAITAFSGGPRVCVGRSFAYREMKTVLVEFLSKFVFETVGRSPKMLNPTLMPKSIEGLKVKVRRAF
jgi:cytochrome P450